MDKWPASYLDGFHPVNSNQWELEVDGLVEKPQRFTLKDFAQFTRIQQNRRLVFADGYTYRDTWEGFVVQELLHRLVPLPEAQYLKQTNACGQVEYIALKDLYAQRALFCLRVRGKGLPATHGGPLRLMVFDRYAHKGLGQLTKLELIAESGEGHFANKGYPPDALIQPGSYYACDLQRMETIQAPGEVLQW
ncbi:molybdopterin-dependent oxidoreductase [Vampirovibrio chlorellavorus]|uniref:molybdopterin-dependent oxidoreductase n=1 Tax=Vampirovibrio chlorellavorus TaxID=758823 RepID=UPI0026F115CD|nr:molybdopterin-dependent oxidoreductase [Vampirovibrio chlorellavorus]